MGMMHRIAWMGWALVALAGCQYADLDDPPVDEQLDAAPAFQVYLRPKYPPPDRPDSMTVVEQQIVIRDRRTGDERVVDSVTPSALPAPTNVNTRMLTFGRFSSALDSDLSSGGQSRITEAQNRRLVYLKGGTVLGGAQLWELQLDRRDAPTRQLSPDNNICSLFDPVYDFSDIENTVVPYQLPGTSRDRTSCAENNERPQRVVRLNFDPNRPPIVFGSDGDGFTRLGRPLRPDGSVIRELVFNEFAEDVLQTDFFACPFFLRDERECQSIMRLDNMNGCRRRDGCVSCPPTVDRKSTCTNTNTRIRTLQGGSTREDDLSVNTRRGPPYRLSNQFFRIGGVTDTGTLIRGTLVLYLDNEEDATRSRFINIHSYKTQFRRNGFINCEKNGPDKCEKVVPGDAGTKISASALLNATVAVVEDPGSDESDFVFFSDGSELHRIRLRQADPSLFSVERVFPPEGAPEMLGEIRDVRRLGNEIVFRWCGPITPEVCTPDQPDAVCQLQRKSCPEDAHERDQVLYAMPLTGGVAVPLDGISGGTLDLSVLTSTAYTYTAEMRRDANGGSLAPEDVQREARFLSVDRDQRVFVRRLLSRLPNQENVPFDGSGWLSEVQRGDEASAGGGSIVRSKLKGDDEIDVASSQSFVLAFRNTRRGNPRRDTELFALDLGALDSGSATSIGVVLGRKDLRDHPDCIGISPASGRRLPGALAGSVFGFGRQALIQLNIPRSAAFDFELPDKTVEKVPALSDFDIYAADLTMPNSLQRISTTPPPRSSGKRVFCPDMNPTTPIPMGLDAANDVLIAR